MRSDPATRTPDHSLPEVPGYELLEVAGGTPTDVIFRAVDAAGRRVLIEMYRRSWPGEAELAVRRHAFDIGSSLAGAPHVLDHVAIVPTSSDVALVTADPGLPTLGTWLAGHDRRDLPGELRIAAGLAAALRSVHEQGVVHNDVAPHRFHVDATTGTAFISGFGASTRLLSQAPIAAAHPSLAYMAPEQSGRTNRPVDMRSDLYALGVVIFELLTHRLPFVDVDPLTLVHAHIARPAPRITDIDATLPETLATVVATLLDKNAESRYATAAGLQHDLDALAGAVEGGDPSQVSLRSRDIPPTLVLPQTLYGRDAELAALRSAVDAAMQGDRRALFVAGYSGIGKSQLVNEVQPWLLERSGWFGAGKSDLYRRDLPYRAWVGAIEQLVREALTLPENRLAALRGELSSRLGANAATLIQVVPALGDLVDATDPLPGASPGEAQTRINQAFRNLVQCFATADTPLVLFLDDLQWADLASLRLLEAILSDRATSHLVVLGAWRDNEVGPDHPLHATLRNLDERAVLYEVVTLGPLPARAIDAFVADVVHQPVEETAELGRIVGEKTGGNPFFMRQFLEELHREDLLVFDRESRSWTWDASRMARHAITDNVGDLLSRRLATVEPAIARTVGRASAIGSEFDLGTVADIADDSPDAVARALDGALAEGFLVPLDEAYRYATVEGGSSAARTARYAFAHDRVREAAHASLLPGERAATHLALAHRWIDRGDDWPDEWNVTIASHLREADDLLIDEPDRIAAARVFLAAGRRSRRSMATEEAAAFLRHGLALLPSDAWERHYDLSLDLHVESAEVAYIEQRFDAVEEIAPLVLERGRTNLDRSPIHVIRIGVGVARRAYRDATLYALDILHEEYGISLPRDPTTGQVMAGVVRTKLALRGRSTDDLLELPAMSSLEVQAAMDLLMKTATNAYWAMPNLVPLIAFEMCRLSVDHGNIGLSAYGYALYGMVQAGALGQIAAGYAFGRLAMDLLERTGDTHLVGKTALLWHGFIRHARDPIRECAADVLAAYDTALDAGDVENAVYCGTVGLYMDVLAGRPIPWIRSRYAGYIHAMFDSGQDQTIGALRAWLQCIDNLADPDRVEPRLIGQHVDFERRLPDLLAAEIGTATPIEASAAGFLAFVLDEMDLAEDLLRIAWETRDDAPGQAFKTTCFAMYLTTLIRRTGAGVTTPNDRLRMVRLRRSLEWRARHNPHDAEPWLAFVTAERLRSKGDDGALQHYLRTATMAHDRGMSHLEALALDEAAALQGARGHLTVAAHLHHMATETWRRHGALAKLRVRESVAMDPGAADADPLGALDARALLETVHALSGEIELDKLLERVMAVALQGAGANRGLLLLAGDDGLEVASCAEATGDGITMSPPADAAELHATTVVDLAVRTGRPVAIDDATTDDVFRHDPHVVAHQSRSILCVPLMRTGELVGVLYLENTLGVGSFTERDQALIEAIGGQAAVSVENARLFEHERAQTEAFAHFVPRPFLQQLERRSVMDVRLGDAVRADLAVLFSDLRGFTSLSERLGVDASFALLNEYLAEMEPPIHANGGFVDKFIGDGIMALFVDRTEGAVAAAVGMHAALRRFNLRDDLPTLQMGIGIHAGPAMLGTVGSSDRMETTVIGDTVNTASRIEGMTKAYAAPTLVSEAVAGRLTDPMHFTLRQVGRVRALGKEHDTTVFEVLDGRTPEERTALAGTLAKFEAALEAWYAGDLAMARDGFAECHAAAPFDLLAEAYVGRCSSVLAKGVPEDWDGVDVRSDK